MKKRILSGLLAAMMLVTPAFAAGGSAADTAGQPAVTAEASGETVLTFAVTLPESFSTDRMEDAVVESVRAVLTQRLAQLDLADASVDFPDDRQSVVVTLPAGAEATGVADFLAQTNALRIADAADDVWLTSADIETAEAGLNEDDTYHVQLTLTEAGQEKLAEKADGADTEYMLYVSLDGEDVASLTAAALQETPCTLAGPFTGDEARLLTAFIMAGELPVTLTPVEAETPSEPTEPEQPEQPEEPAEPAFPDIAGHWAEDALNTAVEMGLLNGVDGRILPNNPVKRSEAVVILNRVLGASTADSTAGLTGTPQNAWYINDLGKAIHLGLIDAADSRNFNTASTRAEAFVLMARAFVYERAEATSDELDDFTDTGSMTDEQLQAAAALVAAGIVNGSTATTLRPDAQLTRAEFVTMVTRVADQIITDEAADSEAASTETDSETPSTETDAETADSETTPTETDSEAAGAQAPALRGGSVIAQPVSEVKDTAIDGDLIYAVDAADVRLSAVDANGRIVLKGAEQTALYASNGTEIDLLAADPAGSAEIDLNDSSRTGTLLIAGRGGAVSFAGEADNVEITASGRTIDLSGLAAETLTVTGSNNTITVSGSIGAIAIDGGAKNNRLTLNGTADTLLVAGVGSKVDGSGKAAAVDIRAVNCEVTVASDSKIENIDSGLSGVSLSMGVPTKVLPGGSLVTQITFQGVTTPKICSAQWYKNGKPMAGYSNDHFEMTADAVSRITTYFTFTKDMETSVTMGFKLTYENPSTDETEELYIEKTVPIENYSDEWYYERDVNRVLNLVSSTYRGNYTTSYAVNNDYSALEKEIWINAKGYSSKTQYLIWVNRAYPHANVFQGSKGNWKLIKSFLVGIGAPSTPTPTGVTTVSYKSAGGWTTSSYTVRPVVGFYPGTGYAFHSRLCYPGTDTEYDFSAGYPVSHGCVRMYKNDVKWIYNNIPVGTTVVIH